ncbi:MAG: GNAT family N-acetyltransferase [Turicibacter sp.]|nr:GNAT family N-acetyltransferase [Turicibacter sp.]
MQHSFCNIDESAELLEQAKRLLLDTFTKVGMWLDLDEKEAAETIEESLEDGNICIGIKIGEQLIGWVGLRPMYKLTWELHPLVLAMEWHGRGYGKILMQELEQQARKRGIIGIFVGSDDEAGKTSLSNPTITNENVAAIFDEIRNISNYDSHPYEFYVKCGFSIVGIIPNANGKQKPDILLWKDISH